MSFASRKSVFLLIGVLLVTFLSFWPVLGHSVATWDDQSHITENIPVRQILSLDSLKAMFRDNICRTYIPLTTLTFALEHHFFKLAPFVYHLDNLLLHLANVALVFFLARLLGFGETAGLFGALFFAVHPMHVESVAWASERKDVLYSFFYLSALLAYIRYTDRRSWGFLLLSLLLTLLSILSKAMALSLPLVLFLVDWFRRRRSGLWMILDKIPFFLIVVPVAWITYSMNVRVPSVSLVSAGLTWVWTFVFYLRKFIFPYPLIPLYMLPKPVQPANLHYLAAVVLLGLTGFGVWRFRKNRVVVFAFLYYVFSVFFLMRVDDVVDINIVADRFMYLPSVGICFLAGWLLERMMNKTRDLPAAVKITARTAAALLFTGMMVMTFFQSRVWKNDITLWSHVLRFHKDSDMAYVGLGQEMYGRGKTKQALEYYFKALRLNPRNAKASNNMGQIFYRGGMREAGLQYFENAVKIKPDYAEALNNYGVALMAAGELESARHYIQEAVYQKPDQIYFLLSLGDVYLRENDLARARKEYEKVLARRPHNAGTLNRLGVIYWRMGDLRQARAYFEEALKNNPGNKNIWRNLEAVLQAEGGREIPAPLREYRPLGLP